MLLYVLSTFQWGTAQMQRMQGAICLNVCVHVLLCVVCVVCVWACHRRMHHLARLSGLLGVAVKWSKR